MQGERDRIRDLDEPARSEAIARAAGALRDGRLVVFPTETVYGVAARADLSPGVDRLRGVMLQPEQPLALHASGPEDALAGIELHTPVARRLAATLLPGPVTLLLAQSAEQLEARRAALRVARGVIDDGSEAAVRLPDHDIARALLDAAGGPVVATALGATRFAAGTGETASLSPDWTTGQGEVLDDGPCRFAMPSTRVRIGADGRLEVSPEGPLSEGDVLARLEIRVLFACTGNTCRSPMAEALARSIATEREPNGVTFRFESAGVAAGEGVPASAGAFEAALERGLDLSDHRSRRVTRRMVELADAVYTMTPSHAQAIMTMLPTAAHKIEPLDPRGLIADPIGQPVEVYAQTLEELEPLIRARLKELEP
ncbi:MAG: Sua5/YciO/YrdC/YwlC family protein [Planctomycetota bacterium]